MSDAARRKERQRLKREKKKAQERRAMAGSPYKRIGQVGRIEACYINADWEAGGIASIHLIRQNPQGGMALACFVIDLWCAGLKDAWGAIDMTSDDTDGHLKRAGECFDLVRIEPEAARHLVAGAIRFAHQNGFRLPPRFERWTNVLGDLPDIATADLSPFGKDGGLLWVGSFDDLQSRLIGCSVDEFLARPNVHFVSEVEDFDEEDEDDDEDIEWEDEFLDEVMDNLIEEKYQKTHRQCLDRGETPSPLMRDAIQNIVVLAALTIASQPEPNDSLLKALVTRVKDRFAAGKFDCSAELEEAMEQVFRVRELTPEPEPAVGGELPQTAKA